MGVRYWFDGLIQGFLLHPTISTSMFDDNKSEKIIFCDCGQILSKYRVTKVGVSQTVQNNLSLESYSLLPSTAYIYDNQKWGRPKAFKVKLLFKMKKKLNSILI